MAIDIKLNLVGNPEPPTIILANRNGNKLGQLKVNEDSISLKDSFADISEISFTVNKYINDEITPLWDKLVDFKLIYCKEWDLWMEAKVELDEETKTVKTVFCTQLGQAELSQIHLYNIEINTKDDIARDDYKISVLYNEEDPESSILNRMLEKAPHYSIDHVDSSIANIQRSFSFDGTSIYDAFKEVAEEIGCLFVYDSNSDENGKIKRTISVYDLWYSCEDCGYRNESEGYFINNSHIYLIDELENMLVDESDNYLLYRMETECPKCGSKQIRSGHGVDTLIFVTSDELASGGIKLVSDIDSVKNCFKLKAGDDLMTATIRNCNPNGTDYIWRISDSTKDDMSEDLVDKINNYNIQYEQYYNNHISELDENLVVEYNNLVKKYEDYYNSKSICLNCDYEAVFNASCPNCGSNNILSGNFLQSIPATISGYSKLMNAYYNTIDLALYLKSSLMPNVEMSGTTAKEQANLLTASSLSPVAVNTERIESVSLSTANSAVLSMAKVIVSSTYKVDVNSSTLSDDNIWEGNFVITNYSDENDTYISDVISIEINNDTESFVRQKIEKELNKKNTDDYSVTGLFEKELKVTETDNTKTYSGEFYDELKKYALNPLQSFYDVCGICLDILIKEGAGNETEKPDLYENLYEPYYQKSSAIADEIKIRESEISIIEGVWDKTDNENPELVAIGLQQCIENCRDNIQYALNFENYLGKELWLEFCAYRREDEYSNDNYISDGLNNAELFEKALEFFEIAENDIYKSSELQYSISTTLNNLLAIPKFKPLVESFKTGNWIRIRIDDKIYKLRLLEYEIDYGDFDNIPVEFSEVTKVKNGITDVKSILSQASSMATSYSSVRRQASKGEESNSILSNWIDNGLNTTNLKIVNTENQNQVWDKNGILCREYDPITGEYNKEQLKIINSTIAVTDDNWEHTKTAIGKYYYSDPITGEQKVAYGINGETIVGKLLIGEQLDISNDNGNLGFGKDGLVVKNNVNIVNINPSNESIFNISNESGNIFSLNEKGELVIVGNITASNLVLLDGTKIESENIAGLSDVAISGSYKDLEDKPTNVSEFKDDVGYLKKNDLNNAIDTALEQAKTSGDFDGKDGISATHSWSGTTLTITSASGTSSANLKGEKGNTPIRGTDYWTDNDKLEIVNAVLEELRNKGVIS